MARIGYGLCFCLVLFVSIKVGAQTQEAKPKPTGSISGRVTVGDKPLPGVVVVAGPVGSPNPSAQAVSDAEGNYRLNGLPAGQLNVSPVAPVYVQPPNPMFNQGRSVNLAANESVDSIDFKLTRGGVITGRITDADGRPAVEERVNVVQVDDNGAQTRGLAVRPPNYTMYSTDDRGIYRIYGLPPGHYKVSAGDDASRGAGIMRAAGYYPRVFYPDAPDMAKAGIVDVTAGGETKNIDIKLGRRTATFSVTGRIIDADTNQPLAGVYYSFSGVQQNQDQSYITGSSGSGTPTNAAGEFRMEGMSPGRYAVMINSQDFFPGRNSTAPKVYADPVIFEVVDTDLTNLEVKAQRGLSISGVIVPDGITDKNILARLAKLMITAYVSSDRRTLQSYPTVSTTQINADGGFVIDGLRPGKINLSLNGNRGADPTGFALTRIELEGGVAQNRIVELTAGQNLTGIKLHIVYGTGLIRGTVKTTGAALPPDTLFMVNLNRPGEGDRFGDQVDSRGRFTLKGIPAGTYEMTLQIISMTAMPGMPRNFPRPLKQSVTVTDGAETEVVFVIDLTPKEGP